MKCLNLYETICKNLKNILDSILALLGIIVEFTQEALADNTKNKRLLIQINTITFTTSLET